MVAGVAAARKRYNVRYPLLYAPEGAANAKEFNCVQRGVYIFIPLSLCEAVRKMDSGI